VDTTTGPPFALSRVGLLSFAGDELEQVELSAVEGAEDRVWPVGAPRQWSVADEKPQRV
ncbi:MAG: hypothetical protein HOQ21_02570, partial [Dermatophilaceae bacterium]|nr:hypothetical protein [Dermatophilaceae bacterium]